jgi:hypothetical protein
MTAKEVGEIESVKRLLILLLLKLGATSQEIGAALRIDSSAIRKIAPVRKIKKIEFIR